MKEKKRYEEKSLQKRLKYEKEAAFYKVKKIKTYLNKICLNRQYAELKKNTVDVMGLLSIYYLFRLTRYTLKSLKFSLCREKKDQMNSKENRFIEEVVNRMQEPGENGSEKYDENLEDKDRNAQGLRYAEHLKALGDAIRKKRQPHKALKAYMPLQSAVELLMPIWYDESSGSDWEIRSEILSIYIGK